MACSVFFFNDTATTEIYALSLHDALPVYGDGRVDDAVAGQRQDGDAVVDDAVLGGEPLDGAEAFDLHRGEHPRSEEHTSELQSRQYLVCRLLLEKKKPTLPAQMSSSTPRP